jgi:hypothetical protein
MKLNININKDSLDNNNITELLNFFETLDKQDIIGLLEGNEIGWNTKKWQNSGLKIKIKKQY